MKKITLATAVFFLAFFLALPQNAQSGVRFGLKGGVNGAKLIGEDAKLDGNWKDRIAYCGGILISFNLGNILAIQPEVMYTMKGAKMNDIDIGGQLFNAKITAGYIEIPLLLKLRLPLGIITPFVFGGPSVGFRLGDAKAVFESTGGSFTETIEEFEKYDYGAVIGGGLELNRNLWIDVRYSTGLKKLIKEAGEGTLLDYRNAVLSATVSIVF